MDKRYINGWQPDINIALIFYHITINNIRQYEFNHIYQCKFTIKQLNAEIFLNKFVDVEEYLDFEKFVAIL